MKRAAIAVAQIAVGGLLLTGAAAPPALGFDDPYGPGNDATITGPHKITTYGKRFTATFEFESPRADSTFGCSFEGRPSTGGTNTKPLQPCSSPKTYTRKAPGLKNGKKNSRLFTLFVFAESPSGGEPMIQPRAFYVEVVRKPKPHLCGGSDSKPGC